MDYRKGERIALENCRLSLEIGAQIVAANTLRLARVAEAQVERPRASLIQLNRGSRFKHWLHEERRDDGHDQTQND
jgi:hypothetical protein